MGYYPPLTDYLADWRMDKIKGEDLQDPTARNRISTLSQQVSSMSTNLATLATTVTYKRDKIDGSSPAWNISVTRGDGASTSGVMTPDGSPYLTSPIWFYWFSENWGSPVNLYYDTSLSTPSWCFNGFNADVQIGPTDLHATSMTFNWRDSFFGNCTATLTLSRDTPITYHSRHWQETSAEVSNLSSDVMDLQELTEGLSKGYPLVVPEQSRVDTQTTDVTIVNRTLSYLTDFRQGLIYLPLLFPEPQGSVYGQHSRDFIVYIDIAPRDLFINLPLDDDITFIVPEGENLSDMTTIETGVAACLYFSEVMPDVFAVHRVTFEAAV